METIMRSCYEPDREETIDKIELFLSSSYGEEEASQLGLEYHQQGNDTDADNLTENCR